MNDGPLCDNLNSLSASYYASYVVSAVLSSLVFCTLSVLLVLVCCGRGATKKTSAMNVAITFTWLGSGFTALFTSLDGSSWRPYANLYEISAKGEKVFTLGEITGISLILAFFFSFLGMLQISIAWLEIASMGHRLQKVQDSSGAKAYKILLYLYYIVLLIGFFLSVFTGNLTIMAIVAIPAMAFVVGTYLVGYFMLRRLLHESSGTLAPSRENVQILRRIEQTTLSVSFVTSVFLASMITFVAGGGWASASPINQNAAVATAFIWVSGSILQVTMSRYFVVSVWVD